MRKKIILTLALLGVVLGIAMAQQTATLSAQVYGYQQDMVYVDCMQTPLIAQEFYNNPGEEYVYTFECDGLVYLTINGRNAVLLQPGDSLHVDITYEGKNTTMVYSGTERAVNNNRLMKSVEGIKRGLRYKSQLLGCAALDIKPKTRIDDSRTLLERIGMLLEKSPASQEAKNYVAAMTDYDVYMSFIEYPVMYAEVRGLAVAEQEIGDYWNIMEGYTARTDAEALRSPEYASLLMRYCFYMNEKAARAKGEQYAMPSMMEDMYREVVGFYEGDQRDFLIYTLLRNFIMNGQEIERADVLYKEYLEKYNTSAFHKGILEMLLQ